MKSIKQVINKPYVKVFVQIFLMIMMTVAFSYIVHESDTSFVSAQSGLGVNTCLVANDGSICQEFLEDECDQFCDSCIDSTRDQVSACNLGTCFTPQGTCSPNSPQDACEADGGEFFDDAFANINECQLGCCTIGSQPSYKTAAECQFIRDSTGTATVFNSELSPLECVSQAVSDLEGACVVGTGNEKTCVLTSVAGCQESSGQSYPGWLCSHPTVEATGVTCNGDTILRQQTTSCVEDKHGVFWIDSCGNKENIYEGDSQSQRDISWNEGVIKTSNDACTLTQTSDGTLVNQGSCGNCQYIETSTTCGDKTDTDYADFGDVVCKDISCVDEDGNDRVNGESWCIYGGTIGVQEGDRFNAVGSDFPGLARGADTPGSRHGRRICIEGEVQVEACEDYRKEVCTEERFDRGDGNEVSQALCRKNMAQACIGYNLELADNKEQALLDCADHPDCFVKQVRVKSAKLDFDVCAPKYPKAYEDPLFQETICGLANIQCVSASIRTVGGRDHINWGCLRNGFVQQMNDFCMSLGDCGAQTSKSSLALFTLTCFTKQSG